MHNPFQQTELIKAQVFTSLPARFRKPGRHEWTAANLANIAVGGADKRTLYIVQALTGEILTAQLPVAGKNLYAHT